MTHQPTKAKSEQSVQLHLTRFEGQSLQLRWSWPAEQTQVSLSMVLDNLNLPAQAVEEAHRVTLQVARNQTQQAIAVQHTCQQLRCSINGQKLAANHLAWLQQGDVLDVGLCRIALEASPQTQQALPPKIDEVDLTALASSGQMRTSVDRLLTTADAFDDLLKATPWRTTKTTTDGFAPKPQEGDPFEPQAPIEVNDIADGLTSKSPNDPLGQWHTHYLRRLQSPNEPLQQGQWVGLSAQQKNNHADVLDELMQQSKAGPDLSALLGQDTHINTVLGQLDAHGINNLLTAPERVNVLHLFAPEGWTAADQNVQVPRLSRQEHHGMALDSAVSLSTPQKIISENHDT